MNIYIRYQWLSAMHEKTIKAFEIYENNQDDVLLRELLDEWRGSLGDCETDEEAICKEKLIDIEQKLHSAYSPVVLSIEYITKVNKDLARYLNMYKNEDIIKEDNALLISRLLYNCHLLEECFFPLLKNGYENHIKKVLDQLNICIIISQLDYFSEYFRSLLLNFNDEFMSIKETTAHILHVVGVLNFKCHNYEQVVEYFKKAAIQFENEFELDTYKNNEYFQTRLLLAYSYEYNHQFEQAINELIGLDIDVLIKIFKDSNFRMFDMFDNLDIERAKVWSGNFIDNTLKRKVLENNKNTLFEIADKRDEFNRNFIGDKHEILHSLAHCLNELGIKWKIEAGKNKERVIHLLSLSRAIMLYVAELDTNCFDFQTCLYMIFGEAKDYDMCLKRINELIDRYQKSVNKNINYEMENMFYLFLVSNQSNKTLLDNKIKQRADEAYLKYVNFAKRRFDYDALIHIEIFRFRFEILQVLFSSLNNLEIEKKLISLKMQSVGKNMFSIMPSAKVNKWIIQEYDKAISLYEFLVKYFADEEKVNINELYNFASRFDYYRNFFQLSRDGLKSINRNFVISDVIDLIIDDFVSPQSIFILAPLTSALPYQHQTKNLSTLEESMFSTNELRIEIDEKMEHFANLNNIIFGMNNSSILNWLFQHKDYDIAFVAFKHDLDEAFDRYFFCSNECEIFERPILNISRLNDLLRSIRRSDKKHPFCKNGQTKCCTTVITNKAKAKIYDICAELILPFEKYHNKHFIFFYKGSIAGNRNHSWYIVAFNNELNALQTEEITLYLCGHGLKPTKRLALSNQNYCFVSFDIVDFSLATNDLMILQEGYNFRFWYNKEVIEGNSLDDSAFSHIDNSLCVMFFISVNTTLSEKSRLYQEILRAMDKKKICFIICIGFSKEKEFSNLLCQKIGRNVRCEEVLSYMTNINTTLVLRSQKEFSFKQHITEESKFISDLRSLGVLRDE